MPRLSAVRLSAMLHVPLVRLDMQQLLLPTSVLSKVNSLQNIILYILAHQGTADDFCQVFTTTYLSER